MPHVLLLAEPSLTIQRVVQLTFANEDIDIVVVTDGAEAMAQAERVRPSIVLADVALARHTGYEVAEYFKQHPKFADVPVVLLSGAFERVDAARATASGCDLVLSKPFEPRHLLAEVKGLIAPPGGFEAPVDEESLELPPPGHVPSLVGFVPSMAPQAHPDLVEIPDEKAPLSSVVFGRSAVPDSPSAPDVPAPSFGRRHPDASFPAHPAAAGTHVETNEISVDVAALSVEKPAVAPPLAEAPVPDPIILDWEPTLTPEPTPEWVPEPVVAPVDLRVPAPAAGSVSEARRGLGEPVPSFEMLSLSNKAMHLVPPPGAAGDTTPPEPPPVPAAPSGSHDLGDLIPSLDDYFDQLDAAFASHGDTAFRRPLDLPAPLPPPPPVAMATPAPVEPVETRTVPASGAAQPFVPPPAAPTRPAGSAVETIHEPNPDPLPPPVSPFSRRRTDSPAAAPAGTIDDAYDALMKQLQEPRPRPSVVALRADDQLLVERAVERVLTQLGDTTLTESTAEAVTALAKRIIQEEIERVRRP